MRTWMRRHVGRLVLGAPLVLVGFGFAAQPVGASFSTCGSDPVVMLSNGATVTLSATIGESADAVQRVVYDLRVPHRTTVVSITYGGDVVASKELLRVHDSAPDGTYESGVLVITQDENIPVTATATVVGTSTATASVSGYAGQFLTIRLTTGDANPSGPDSGPDHHGDH